jgi:hypothetical protein
MNFSSLEINVHNQHVTELTTTNDERHDSSCFDVVVVLCFRATDESVKTTRENRTRISQDTVDDRAVRFLKSEPRTVLGSTLIVFHRWKAG